MARIRNNYVFTSDKPKATVYPWDEWMDGNIWEAREGRDYTISTKSFKDNLKYQARSKNMTLKYDVSTFRGAEVVIFQFITTKTPTTVRTNTTRTIAKSTSRKRPTMRRKSNTRRIGITAEEKAAILDRAARATDLPTSAAELNGETIHTPLLNRRHPSTY